MNIIIHGSIAYDRIMNFPGYFKEHILPDKIHSLNVSFQINKLSEMRGGTGGNIAYNMVLLEETPMLLSCVGSDGETYLHSLKELGVRVDAVEKYDDIYTAVCHIITDRGNNQITAFSMGAAARPVHFDFSTVDPKDALVIFAPANNKIDSLQFIAECKKYGIRYIFDPGQTITDYNGKELKECIHGAYIFIANDYELQLTMQKTGLTEPHILERTEILITTLGEKGSVIKNHKEVIDVPAFLQHHLIDPTGAGDAYRAGLVKGLTAGLPLQQCGYLAACAASYAIEHIGTQSHTYTIKEFRERYKYHLHTICPI